MTSIRHFLVLSAAACWLPVAASAQDVVAHFRLAGDPNNVQGCMNYDSSMTRVHTFTLKGGQAEVTSAGGINDKMKPVRPNVYDTVFALGRVHLDVVADLGSTPKSLTVTEKNAGCKWSATAP